MDLNELNELRDQYQKAVRDAGQDPILQECQKYLEENPEVKAVGWYQYTPSFNDGDPCYFSVGELWETKEEDFEKDLWEWDYCKDDDLFSAVMSNNDLLEAAFGDDKQIVITRDGVEISDYYCGY